MESPLGALGSTLAQAGQWIEAERVIGTIQNSSAQAGALDALGGALTQAEQWAEAERVIGTIQNSVQQAKALSDLATMMARTDKLEQVLHVIQRSWRQAETRGEALTLFCGIIAIISHTPDIGTAFLSAFSWANNFLGG
jgi:hypothetical protein